MELNLDQIRALVELAAEKKVAELTVEQGETKITVCMPNENMAPQTVVYGQPAMTPVMAGAVPTVPHAPATAPPAVETSSTPATIPAAVDANLHVVTSPMVGTFYQAPSPESAPFVEVGKTVQNGQTLCIIEAMKLMNELEADVSGKVVEILVKNGEPVEFGQPLFKIQK